MADDPITRPFFHGFIRRHILYHVAKAPVYGAEITEELSRHGYRLGQGTRYPTWHLLEQRGYLTSCREAERGRWRTYSRATAAGRGILNQARYPLLELVAQVVEGHDEPFRTIRQKHRSPTGGRCTMRGGVP